MNHHEHEHKEGHSCCHHHGHEHGACHCHSHEHEHEEGPGCSHHHEHEHGEEEELSTKMLILAAALFALGLLAEHLPIKNWLSGINQAATVQQITCLICYFFAYIIAGRASLKRAFLNLIHGRLMDESFLMSISSIGAILLGKYEEAVAIMVLYQVGEKFEDYATDKSRDAIAEIAKLRPDHATIKTLEGSKDVPLEEVEKDSLIIVKPGERIPIDGIIADGESFVDTAALTGESLPRHVQVGDEVLSGSINKQGVLEIRTTRYAGDSALARILQLVENASENKTKSEQFVTRFARVYTPIVVAAALVLAIVPSLISGFKSGDFSWQATWADWVYRALMFLVVSCPCAIVISIPLSFCGGITAAARRGILIKGSVYLEALGRTQIAVFDKTGTLTKGNFVVSHIHATNGAITEDELLALATHTEMFSTHPISASLKAAHHADCCDRVKLENVEEISGEGIKALVNGKEVLAGNTKLMERFGVKYDECPEHRDGTIVHVASAGIYSGHIVISDEIKDDAEEALRALKAAGVKDIVMLTGDNRSAAEIVAKKLGIARVFSELLSADKLAKVEELLATLSAGGQKSGSLIFTGDGINDAPVLARADVGIAMGSMGSDAAIEAADIIIMEDKPAKIAEGVAISRKTLRIVYENLIGSLGIKATILIFSALGLSSMWLAVFGDVGVTILAVLNALRLLGKAR